MTASDRRRIDALLQFVTAGNYGRRRRNPCRECPWRRRAIRGWLGPHTPEGLIDMAHGEGPIHCHMSIPDDYRRVEDDVPDTSVLLQCAGAARFRRHVHKTPRNPTAAVGPEDRETVFATNDEFLEHHAPIYYETIRRRERRERREQVR